jgi:xylulokinase
MARETETNQTDRDRTDRDRTDRDQTERHTTQIGERSLVTIGIDIGTTAVKAVVADADGRIERRVRVPHRLVIPTPDRMEHDAVEAWADGPLKALAELDRRDAAALAVSAMVPSLTAVDARGAPVTPGLLYGDSRGRTDEGTAAIPGATAEALGFLRWSAAEAPDAAGFWSAQAVANVALCGEAALDFGTAFTTNPLFGAAGWDADVLSGCGVSVDQMPRVEMMGAPIGKTGDTVVAAGSIDAMCEQIVAGADSDGDVLVLCGTTLITWAVMPEWKTVPNLWTIPHTAPGKCMIGGASNAGGLFLNRVNGWLGPGDGSLPSPDHVPIWAPYIRGERTPLHDPNRRAVLDRVDLTHDAAAVRRAAYEAAGFVVRRHLELAGPALVASNGGPRRIVATGGGTRVAAWLQAIADATGLPVDVAEVPEGAALGAAFLARIAAGEETDMVAASRWARTAGTVEPDPVWREAMEPRYERFVELSGPLT